VQRTPTSPGSDRIGKLIDGINLIGMQLIVQTDRPR
jgi:hypothetical protein